MIFGLFSELNKSGLTMVVVTHNLDLARRAEKMHGCAAAVSLVVAPERVHLAGKTI